VAGVALRTADGNRMTSGRVILSLVPFLASALLLAAVAWRSGHRIG
jgi:hypothetical protein